MRIIAGKHKGRNIRAVENHPFRPTTSRTREAIFSILASGRFLTEEGDSILEGATIMDLYCGTGSLGLEALSRGAAKVVAIDIEQESINMVKENARSFQEQDNVITIRSDACALPKAKISADIVFMDPPYDKNLILPSLESLKKQNWLKNGAVIVAELDKSHNLEDCDDSFQIIDHRIYGKTQIYILIYENAEETKS